MCSGVALSMAHKESLASPGAKLGRSKSTKGSPSLLDSSDSRALKIRSVTKAAQSASVRINFGDKYESIYIEIDPFSICFFVLLFGPI